jgi:hypothetical protein
MLGVIETRRCPEELFRSVLNPLNDSRCYCRDMNLVHLEAKAECDKCL